MRSKATEFQDKGLEWQKHCSLPSDLYSRGSALEEKKKKVIGKTSELNAKRKFLLLLSVTNRQRWEWSVS